MLVLVHYKKNFCSISFSRGDIAFFYIWVVSMEALIEEVSNNNWFNFFCNFCEWQGQLQLLTNLRRDLRHSPKIGTAYCGPSYLKSY